MKSWVQLQRTIVSNTILQMTRDGVQRDLILIQLGKLLFLDELLSDYGAQIRSQLIDVHNYNPLLS
jgi:hypothetical protein